MPRNPKQKALYEVIKSSQKKIDGRGVWPRDSIGKNADSPAPTPAMAETKIEMRRIQSLGHQLVANLGRKQVLIVPYRVAVILAIVFILALVAAFRLGRLAEEQTVAKKENLKFSTAEETHSTTGPLWEETTEPIKSETDAEFQEQSPLVVYKGDNVVVIATYRIRNDLEPVQEYFARNGIETEIWLRNNYFYLVTKDRFEGTERRGSDGYLMKQKIKKIGADYIAPTGYESFKPNLFQDAYGMKVE